MNKECWKCGKLLTEHAYERGCPACDEDMIFLIKKTISDAKKRADNIGDVLSSFKEKIKSYQAASKTKISGIKNISYAINTLCNIIDLLDEGNSHLISDDDLKEIQQKAQEIITCTQKLLDIKQKD